MHSFDRETIRKLLATTLSAFPYSLHVHSSSDTISADILFPKAFPMNKDEADPPLSSRDMVKLLGQSRACANFLLPLVFPHFRSFQRHFRPSSKLSSDCYWRRKVRYHILHKIFPCIYFFRDAIRSEWAYFSTEPGFASLAGVSLSVSRLCLTSVLAQSEDYPLSRILCVRLVSLSKVSHVQRREFYTLFWSQMEKRVAFTAADQSNIYHILGVCHCLCIFDWETALY